ncbi:MAG TPA: EF-hand domain-containing protein [Methylotenera sp.]|nr:EF-hand domain-containing protein [Methylotenera sp.]
MPLYASAADRTNQANGDGFIKRVADDESANEGTQQTLNLNFSPEDRVRLRKALDDYSRSVDPDHDQIEERRRAMQESIEERFLATDKDNDGSIDRQEATESLPQIARHFSQVDTDQDEKITLDELEAAQARIIERRKTAEAALQAQKQQEAEAAAAAKRKSKQAANPRKQRAL